MQIEQRGDGVLEKEDSSSCRLGNLAENNDR